MVAVGAPGDDDLGILPSHGYGQERTPLILVVRIAVRVRIKRYPVKGPADLRRGFDRAAGNIYSVEPLRVSGRGTRGRGPHLRNYIECPLSYSVVGAGHILTD